MTRSSVLVRLAVVIIFSAVAVGFISSQIFYRFTYLEQIEIANNEITQLSQTVYLTSSAAAYLEDQELIKQVIDGLISNTVVKSALFETESTPIENLDKNFLSFSLYSPFQKSKQVGSLHILPNLDYIEKQAKNISKNNTRALALQASLITIICLFVTYLIITKPMKVVAKEMHNVIPGTPSRLSTPFFHEQSELGRLILDINNMLNKAEKQFNEEAALKRNLEALEKQFRMLFEKSVSPMVLMEPRGSILTGNEAFHTLLNNLDERFKKSFGPILSEIFEDPIKLQRAVHNAFANNEVFTGEFKLVKNINNNPVWMQVVVASIVSDDQREYFQVTLHDISKRKKELEKLNIQANFDQLTKLQNRHSAEQQMLKNIAKKQSFSIILLDLNGFKEINDNYGHDAGDKILIHVANQIKSVCRHDDFICRWGGDEFVILINTTKKQVIENLSVKLEEKICSPCFLEDQKKYASVGVCMGASFYPDDESDMKQLIRLADQSMYIAKSNKSEKDNPIVFFSDIKYANTK